jgi:hypothetical protein
MRPPDDLAAAAWRVVMLRLVLVDACVGGLAVAGIHVGLFTSSWGDDGTRWRRTFAAAFLTAFVSTAALAWWALSVPRTHPRPARTVLGRSVVAAMANFGVWSVLMTLVAWPFWNGDRPPIDLVHLGGPMRTPFDFLPLQLTVGWAVSWVLTMPMGLVFGIGHVAVMKRTRTLVAVRTLQPLARARLFGDGLVLLAAGLAASVDIAMGGARESTAIAGGLAMIAVLDLGHFAITEWRARRLIREALAGTSTVLRVASGEQLPTDHVIPLAPLGASPIQLIAVGPSPQFRVAADAKVLARIPGTWAPKVAD